MILEKGGIVSVCGIWYIIVAIHLKGCDVTLDCLCDHANNMFNWDVTEITYAASLREIHNSQFGRHNAEFDPLVRERPIPYEQIAMVLAGKEDNRFSHWHEDEA